MKETISRILLDQRVRNRIIEYLETASSYEEQLQYEANVPIANVPAEMIEKWNDQVHLDLFDYRGPVYSAEEQAAIIRFNDIWNEVIEERPRKCRHWQNCWDRRLGRSCGSVLSKRWRFFV